VGLSDITIERRTIAFDGQSFDVRGLSFSDLLALAREHRDEISLIFEYFNDIEGEVDIAVLLDKVLGAAPDAVNKAVAMAADEPENAHVVATLPVTAVMEALINIAQLTFKSEEELSRFMEALNTIALGAEDSSPSKSS
jgi:hypothetical protein